MDFQVGDKVRIRSRKDLICEYGTTNEGRLYVPNAEGLTPHTFHNLRMDEYKNIITEIAHDYGNGAFYLKNGGGWQWNQNMVYKLNETEV